MKIVLSLMLCLLSAVAMAEEADSLAIANCLTHWKTHPFGAHPSFRVISSKVSVLGVGGGIDDESRTEKPDLVLIKPNVTVLSKSELKLLNPNGWYCLKANVSVLGKSQIEIDCKASLATSHDSTTVLGANDGGSGGVTVLGATRVERLNCAR